MIPPNLRSAVWRPLPGTPSTLLEYIASNRDWYSIGTQANGSKSVFYRPMTLARKAELVKRWVWLSMRRGCTGTIRSEAVKLAINQVRSLGLSIAPAPESARAAYYRTWRLVRIHSSL